MGLHGERQYCSGSITSSEHNFISFHPQYLHKDTFGRVIASICVVKTDANCRVIEGDIDISNENVDITAVRPYNKKASNIIIIVSILLFK